MMKASIGELRYHFKKIERLLNRGKGVQITRHGRIIARLIPEPEKTETEVPNFLERLRARYGGQILSPTGADLIAKDRSRY
jgi:antitoxin (DNA-binding transcriptional repressor) of toxin-antitoxin stability system